MNILFLEDRGSVSYYLIEALTLRGFQVYDAGCVSDAKSILEEETIDIIIIDLNMNPTGLTSQEQELTKPSGLFTGWVWLTNYAMKKFLDLPYRTIIFSEYIDNLKQHLADEPETLRDYYLINKSGMTNSSIEDVVHAVNKIRDYLNLQESLKRT